HVGPGPAAYVRGAGTVLEIDTIRRSAIVPEPPLFAAIADAQLVDRRAGIVGKAGADNRDQCPAAQHPEGALRAAGRAVTIRIAGITRSCTRSVVAILVAAGLRNAPPDRQHV